MRLPDRTNDDAAWDAMNVWEDDSIQFPRLLAEISATQESLDFEALASSMDLTVEEVSDLFDRADNAWEKAKGNR
jgi:hypothetical protein